MKKKLLCIVLAMAMLLTVMPAQAFAAWSPEWTAKVVYNYGGEGVNVTDEKTSNTYYATFEAADNFYEGFSTGGQFDGWSLTPNGKVFYEAGATITITSLFRVNRTLVLYPCWTPIVSPDPEEDDEFTVSYVNEYGEPATITVAAGAVLKCDTGYTGLFTKKITVNSDITIDSLTSTDSRYEFIGFDYDQRGNVYYFNANWEYKDTVDVIYLDETGTEKTVEFHVGDRLTFIPVDGEETGITIYNSDDVIVADSYVTPSSSEFIGWKREGKTFTGVWNKGEVSYLDASTRTNVTFAAIIGTPIYLNDGDDAREIAVAAETNIPDSNKANFKGWSKSENEVGEITFTAVYSETTDVIITFTKNTGASYVTGASVTLASGASIIIKATGGKYDDAYSSTKKLTGNLTISDAAFEDPDGYEFNGWTYTIGNDSITFNAVLKQKAVNLSYKDATAGTTTRAIGYKDTVRIDANGGQYYGNVKFIITTDTSISAPKYYGKTFAGWTYAYTTGSDIYSNKIVLTAQYTEKATGAAYSYCTQDDDCYIVASAGITDVDPTGWAHDGIHFVLEKGLMTKEATAGAYKFNANSHVTRREVICALYAMENDVKIATATDITTIDNAVSTSASAWVKANGIFVGNENADLMLDETITRQDLTVALMRYAAHFYENLPEDTIDEAFWFADGQAISSYAKKAVNWVVKTGIMLGMDGGYFNPKKEVSRAELATILVRTYEMYDVD